MQLNPLYHVEFSDIYLLGRSAAFKIIEFRPSNKVEKALSDRRVSMGWWPLRLSAKILALLRLSVNLFQLRLTQKLKNKFFVSKS